ncbi:Transposase [Oopsacas minuta]|uniref:Transposase n=1 Tax=Oopsacas minuta TaxID=111878 RepID=A0AAV7JRF9_9METZ|nr:Transposase [Oopsacas minuta]
MGQPIIATTANNIALVAEMCDSDPHITIEQLATSLTLSTGSVHAILTKHLDSKEDPGENCKKLLEKYDQCDERRLFEICTDDETWIRYSEPTRKEQNKVWIVKASSPPALPRPDHWATKVMYTIFFESHGPVCQICTPKGQTVTGHFYATVVLPEIEKHYIERRPATGLRGIKILHDNARPHKSKEVKEKIASIGLEGLKHPPYSPDLAPSDFWLSMGSKST